VDAPVQGRRNASLYRQWGSLRQGRRYAIQHPVFRPVERIDGCYACVVGLPVCHVVRALRGFGLAPTGDAAAACSEELQVDTPCPAIEKILREAQDSEPTGWSQD
jgi:hypothetical protein